MGWGHSQPQSNPWNSAIGIHLFTLLQHPKDTHRKSSQYVGRGFPQCGSWAVFTLTSQHLKFNQQVIVLYTEACNMLETYIKNRINHADQFLNGKYVNMKSLGFALKKKKGNVHQSSCAIVSLECGFTFWVKE